VLRLAVVDASWACDRVIPAFGFFSRLFGLSAVQDGGALLVRGRSVQTKWMPRPISVAFLDESGVVLSAGLAQPGRIYRQRGAAWALEIDGMRPMPPPGARLRPFLRN